MGKKDKFGLVGPDGKVQVTARLYPEEVAILDALQKILDRESRASVIKLSIKEWIKRMLKDPEIAAQVAEETKVPAK